MRKARYRPTIRTHLAYPYINELVSMGMDPTGLVKRHFKDTTIVSRPYDCVQLGAFLEFTRDVAVMLNDPHLGLRLGARRRPEEIGALGLLFSASPTLKDALDGYAKWIKSSQQGTQLKVSYSSIGVSIIYALYDFDPTLTRHDTEFTLASFCSIIRGRIGNSWKPIEIHFEHSQTLQTWLHESTFRAPIFFGQPSNRIIFNESDMIHTISKTNPVMISMLEDIIQRQMKEVITNDSFGQEVLIVIARLADSKGFVALPSIAKEMGLSLRTVQRHLSEEGTTFRQLMRLYRERQAKELLTGALPQSVASVAMSVGYSDTTSFSRAFKSWTDVSPRTFQRNLKAP